MTQNASEPLLTFDHQAAREKIVEAALPNVPFDGWTADVLRQAAVTVGYPASTALRVFPRGPVEAVETWIAMADRRMIEALGAHDMKALKIRERVALAIRLRLEGLAGHREAVRRALGILSLPHNAPLAGPSVWRTVSAIWYAVGDNATDFNYYTKRALLVGVYSATVLYWLEDKSDDFADTWAFLDRRISDVMRVPQALGAVRERLAGFPNPFRFFAPR